LKPSRSPPLPLDIRLWEEGLANSIKGLFTSNAVDVVAQSLCRFLTLASYGFAFGTGGDDMTDNYMRQWLAGMANE